MKVLLIGSGGREHALAWKIAQSPRLDKLYVAPGNAGCAEVAECIDIPVTDFNALRLFAQDHGVDLTVVGPEAPLADGIVEYFGERRLRVFGPSRAAAEIEGSKAFAKGLFRRHGIPSAGFRVFGDCASAREYLAEADYPLVVKADGLAAGKGVFVCGGVEEALAAVDHMLRDKALGKAGEKVVIEEALEGPEVSVLAFTDGRTILILESSHDNKRAFDNDQGPNTGGMGAISPTPRLTPETMRRIEREVLVPVVHAMSREDRPFRGLLYAGLMLTPKGPRVLEFNCRFGDPEAQPLLVRMKGDLLEILDAVVEDRLEETELDWDPRAAVCVVLASGGYPGAYEKGKVIEGLDSLVGMDDIFVFHAGTKRQGGRIVTDGGRVLGITALGADLAEARRRAYEAVGKVRFEGMHYRNDI